MLEKANGLEKEQEIHMVQNTSVGFWVCENDFKDHLRLNADFQEVSLPELIAQTNMDQQSVNRLREELLKMTNWLGKNATTYFVSEYETPSQAYIEKARGY
jgi:hypothetical protein